MSKNTNEISPKDNEKNIIASLYPLTKLTFIICFSVVTIVIQNFYSLVGCFLLLNLLALLSSVYKKFIYTIFSKFLVFCIFVILIQGFFYRGSTVLFSILHFNFTMEGLLYALNLSLIIMNIGGSILLMFEITSIENLVLSIEKAGAPPKMSFVILSTLGMLPILKNRSDIIMSSQRARGVETQGSLFVRMRAFLPTLIPLILASISDTEEKALTLEARGFSLGVKKSYLHNLEKKKIDFILPKVFIIITVLLIAGRIVWLLLK